MVEEARRLRIDVKNDIQVQTVVKNLMALALLPANRIREAFDFLKNSQRLENEDRLAGLFAYVGSKWLDTVTPEKFSVYNDPQAISNCTIMSVKQLENEMGRSPFAPWRFISK